MSVGVVRARRPRRYSQAQLVSAWLGTFELLKHESTQGGHVMSNDALAQAATALLSMIDLDEPWTGRFFPSGSGWKGGEPTTD